jgi:hypothetical protein
MGWSDGVAHDILYGEFKDQYTVIVCSDSGSLSTLILHLLSSVWEQ